MHSAPRSAEGGSRLSAPQRRFEPDGEGTTTGEAGLVAHSYRHRDHWRRRLLALADGLGIALALIVATTVAGAGVGRGHVWFALLTIPGWIVLFGAYGLYSRDLKRVSHSTVDDIPWLFHALIVGALISWLYYDLVDGRPVPTRELLVFAACAFVAIILLRLLARRVARLLRHERVLMIGEDEMTVPLVRKMRSHGEYGLDPVGVLGSPPTSGDAELPHLGSVERLDVAAREDSIDRVFVSTRELSPDEQIALLRRCRELGLKVSLLPAVFDAMGPAVEVDDVEGVTVLGLNPPVLSRSARFAKRAMDICGAALLLLLLAPLLLLVAAAIPLTSRGPVLFRQKRIGRAGRPFHVLKFRTMYADAEQRLQELLALSKDPNWLHLEHDPRITPVGRLLRLMSLDELPQLWNVLKGEMSLVGPRPLIESEDRLVGGWARSRLALTPGITGFWQVLGRTSIPFEEMVKLDYLYVANWSVWNDVRLILRTLPAVLSRRGAN